MAVKRRTMRLWPFFVSLGSIPEHHHFPKPGEVWANPWKPSQPHPVKWQIMRLSSNGWRWRIWLYPDDGSAISIDFGVRPVRSWR